MIDLILSILSPLWGYIAGGLALLLGGWLWKRKNAKIERQEQVIEVYKAKEEIRKEDVKTDEETQMRVDKLRNEVDNAAPLRV